MGDPQSLLLDFPADVSFAADDVGTQYLVEFVAKNVSGDVNWTEAELWDAQVGAGGINIANTGGEFVELFASGEWSYRSVILTLTDAPVSNTQRHLILRFDSDSGFAVNIEIAAVNLVRLDYNPGGGSQSAGASHFMQMCGM
jgi:hypothetical protein